jgi:ABC-2 type transport system ATP-binding protein
VLILDEPANGLDPAGIVEMRDLMKRLKAAGHTVMISSHVLHEIEQICDRVVILNHGRIVVQGRVDELLHDHDKLEIQIDRVREAAWILDKVPWVTDVELEGGRLVVTAPPERAAEVNALLAERGLFASLLRPREESLEQYFLEVTEGDAA